MIGRRLAFIENRWLDTNQFPGPARSQFTNYRTHTTTQDLGKLNTLVQAPRAVPDLGAQVYLRVSLAMEALSDFKLSLLLRVCQANIRFMSQIGSSLNKTS